MTTTHNDSRAAHASVDFDHRDPKLMTIPTSEEWSQDVYGLLRGLLAAETVFSMRGGTLVGLLEAEDGGAYREDLMATLEHAAEGFEQFKAFCILAQGRVLAAREVAEPLPAVPKFAQASRSTGMPAGYQLVQAEA